ncbi:DUF3168 domain-containing protein [Paraburkholderia phymatum]|uniref:DUF3168 domain-containing protein n=1 Tax=Paraburkholderia phymatum (strain DSM 17167 / CIP 108236 / LMG 21445 / STM815) TaxID=391038 RepID=B2JUH9_PARP8|nr:DUF3168 domain-containing protein [Paraburkholderia phymatum]ACC76150.1 hypothetical protein Bphy_7149 [Paraburkholderia phymatum STM815]
MIQEDLQTLLATVAAGGLSPEQAVQNGAFPYIVYSRMASPVNNVLEGNGNPRINNTHFELSIWGQTYAQAVQTAKLVAQTMQGWTVQNVLLRETDLFEADVRLYRVVQEYSVWHYD